MKKLRQAKFSVWADKTLGTAGRPMGLFLRKGDGLHGSDLPVALPLTDVLSFKVGSLPQAPTVASSPLSPTPGRQTRHPVPFRLLNQAGPALRRLPFDLLSLSPDRLMAAAVERVALDDFGSGDFATGLSVLTESAERDARLTSVGRLALRQHILSALTTRLLEEDLRKRRPVQPDDPEIRPLVIVGLPRSGTTLLHRLLALRPGARGLAYWEVRNPIRPPGRDRRLQQSKRQLALLDVLAPGFKTMHPVRAEDPEECWFLLDGSLTSFTFWLTAPVYGYLAWCLEQDQSEGYARYREHLRRFSAERPGEALVLKAPAHTVNLRLLRQILPEAVIVQMHRDPVACVNSGNSLMAELQGAVTDYVDRPRLGQANLDLLARAAMRSVSAREDWPGTRVIDVYYDDLIADPRGVLRSLLGRMGQPFSLEHEVRVGRYLRDDPVFRHGVHRYCSSDFGLRDDDTRGMFEGYYDRFPRLRRAKAEGGRG